MSQCQLRHRHDSSEGSAVRGSLGAGAAKVRRALGRDVTMQSSPGDADVTPQAPGDA